MTKDEMFQAVSEQEDAFFLELQAMRAKPSLAKCFAISLLPLRTQ